MASLLSARLGEHWEQITIDCRGKKPEQVAAAILKQLARHLK